MTRLLALRRRHPYLYQFAKVLGMAVIESSFSNTRLVTANETVEGDIIASASVKRKRLPLDLR
jgi:hypothetical protein